MGNPAFGGDKMRGLPITPHRILVPVSPDGLHTIRRWPKNGIAGIVPIKRCHVRRRFQIGVIWTQIPFVRVRPWHAIPSEKNFSARLAIEQLDYSRAAV